MSDSYDLAGLLDHDASLREELKTAIRNNDPSEVKRILNEKGYPEDPVGKNETREQYGISQDATIEEAAAQLNNLGITNIIVRRAALKRPFSLIDIALSEEISPEILEALCKKGADINQVFVPALTRAASDPQKFQIVLENGADTTFMDAAFADAINADCGEVVSIIVNQSRTIIDPKAPVNESDPYFKPIHLAALRLAVQSMEVLLNAGAQLEPYPLAQLSKQIVYDNPEDFQTFVAALKQAEIINQGQEDYLKRAISEHRITAIPKDFSTILLTVRDIAAIAARLTLIGEAQENPLIHTSMPRTGDIKQLATNLAQRLHAIGNVLEPYEKKAPGWTPSL